ncbi:MAG TPA: hypothetical protein VIG98_02990 [Bacillus sp. (in: firmicutes)]
MKKSTMSQINKGLFQDDFGNLIDPKDLRYIYFLNYESKADLLSLARFANLHNKQANLTKEDLARFLSVEIPKVLPILVDKLNSKDRLACEIVVSADGYMPIWEVNTRIKIESRMWKKSLDSLNEIPQQNGWNSGKNINFQDISEEDEEDYYEVDNPFLMHSYDHGKEKSLLHIFGFTKPLSTDKSSIKKESKKERQIYFLIPKEARECFKTRSLKVNVIPLSYDKNVDEPCAIKTPQLMHLMQALFDDISLKHPKPTPKLGLAPKSIFLPLFKQHVAKSQAYKKIHNADYFDWKDFNEMLMSFAYDKRLIKRSSGREGNTDRIEVIPSNVSKILSSNRVLNETFLEWWVQGKSGITPFLFKSKIFDFDPGMRGLKSDEIAARQLLYKQIKNEMKPDIWYFLYSLLDKCEIESGGKLFTNEYGINVSGPDGILSDNEILKEFLSTMIVFPLCLLGIIETNNPKKELVALGRWGQPPISNIAQLNHSEHVSSNNNNLIIVTPNFEVILQSQSPEGRALAFHLREFCNLQSKSDPNVDPVQIFKLTRTSLARSFRTGNYTWQKITSLLTNAAFPSDIPENVKHELRVWGERYGEIEMRTIEILDCKDELIAESLMNDPNIRKQIVYKIGKTTIEIKPGSRSKILSRCDKLGYFIKT